MAGMLPYANYKSICEKSEDLQGISSSAYGRCKLNFRKMAEADTLVISPFVKARNLPVEECKHLV
eukprot:Pgem_evm1s17218